jgi:IS4 transposase
MVMDEVVATMFKRFSEAAPAAVMVRGLLENVCGSDNIDDIFARSAVRQQVSDKLLFSAVMDLLSLVVCRQRKSLGQAYVRAKDQFEVSLRSVYNKINGVETQVCQALVQHTAPQFREIVKQVGVRRQPLLKGYPLRIVDGNHLTSTDHRLEVLRRTRSGPLPGQALVVLDPDDMLVLHEVPCEDAHAQERKLLPELLTLVQPGECWMADRNFCTTGWLFGLVQRQAFFLVRQHASTLTYESPGPRRARGRTDTGRVFEQDLWLTSPAGERQKVRRITIVLDQPDRNGQKEIHLLSNLPQRAASARALAALYLKRWTIENVFQELEQALRSEINTLAYPGAALLGFTVALLLFNVLSVVKWAIQAEHGREEGARKNLSGYYLAAAVSQDYHGMMIALPAKEWTRRFAKLDARQMAEFLRSCARHVRPDEFQKKTRGPIKPRQARSSGRQNHHVSTARLLAAARK